MKIKTPDRRPLLKAEFTPRQRPTQTAIIVIVEAKAHGLGYLYPPKEAVKDDPESDWLFEACVS